MERKFFPSLVNFMVSGPIVAMVLAKDNAIQQWRELNRTNEFCLCKRSTTKQVMNLFTASSFEYSRILLVFELCMEQMNSENAVHGSDQCCECRKRNSILFSKL